MSKNPYNENQFFGFIYSYFTKMFGCRDIYCWNKKKSQNSVVYNFYIKKYRKGLKSHRFIKKTHGKIKCSVLSVTFKKMFTHILAVYWPDIHDVYVHFELVEQ